MSQGGYPRILRERLCDMVTLDLPSPISLLFSSLPSSFSRYEADSDESKCTSQPMSLDVHLHYQHPVYRNGVGTIPNVIV